VCLLLGTWARRLASGEERLQESRAVPCKQDFVVMRVGMSVLGKGSVLRRRVGSQGRR
jgi:hypothetical protein